MKTISGIEFASEHNGTDVFRVIELAYEQGRKDGHSEQLGTNLAEVGTDCISRQAAIDALKDATFDFEACKIVLEQLPSAEPDIIYCKDCVKHNKRIGDYVEKSDGTYDWIWKPDACPLAEFRGKAQGHEFDYQFCVYAERR